MKFLSLLFLFVSSFAFADTITMAPGSSILVRATETTQIYCDGSTTTNQSVCSIKKNTISGSLCVILDGSELNCFSEIDNALAQIKKLRDGGACR